MSLNITRVYTSPCYSQPDGKLLGEYEATIQVVVHPSQTQGYVELEVPKLDYYAEMGLWFEVVDEKLTLIDFDGAHCLPAQAATILREAGIVVGDEFN